MKLFQLTFLSFLWISFTAFAQVDTIEVYSEAMNKTLKAAVVKPNGYNPDSAPLPTIYVLHGGGGSFTDWHVQITEPGLLTRLADQYNVLIITPSVGLASFYWDSPLQDTVRYETFITQELIPFVDKNYNTIKKREGRGITGLSMGGHGSLMISAKHPELFIAAGSMSGVMNIDTQMWGGDEDFKNTVYQLAVESIGEFKKDPPFTPYTVVGLVDKMKENGTSLLIDCGVDDFLLGTNRQIHQMLLEKGVDHDYTERPGAHTWEYWTEALPFHFLFINKEFEKRLPKLLEDRSPK